MEEQETQEAHKEQAPALQGETENKPKVIEINSKSSIFRYFLGAMLIFGICFVCCIFVFQIVFMQVGVVGRSMQPTINASAIGTSYDQRTDMVFCYRTTNVKYKDIVIIDEGVSGERIIKRVIGEPGKTITFKRDLIKETSPTQRYILYSVFVNGQKLDEDYINSEQPTFQIGLTSNDFPFYNRLVTAVRTVGEFSVTLGEDEFFVMGDNRNHSTDSRFFGPVPRKDILGKVVLQVKYGQSIFGALISTIF